MIPSNHPLVSIVVPIYNVETYLRECLDSICNQTYENLEIILVDDGSPDNCPAICDTYAERDYRIKVIHKQNGGVSDARNCGLEAATGDMIAFVDPDDFIAPHMIETLVNHCPDEQSVTAIDFLRFANAEKPSGTESSEKRLLTDIRSFTRCRRGMFAWGMLYDRGLIEKLRLRFDKNLRNLEDVAWNTTYLAHVDKMFFVPGKMYFYRQNPTSITSRCHDKRWQISSWFAARNSIFAWFAKQDEMNAEALRFCWRYCMNNIFAEAVVSNLNCSDYMQQRKELPNMRIVFPEWILEKLFPKFYYCVYMWMMRMRTLLRNH